MTPTRGDVTPLEYHPLANLLPLMEGDDFEKLIEDKRDGGGSVS